MQEFLITLAKATAMQVVGLFGIFFAFGFILSKLQEWTQKKYQQSVGWKGILFTAWFGTPIHELGHAFFAKLFRHRVNRVSLFQPNASTGGLGHVDHSYNKYSLYQRLGNFFIGAAPMIFGSAILTLMLYYLLPNGREIFLPLTNNHNSLSTTISSLQETFKYLFIPANLVAWNFWLFIYLSFCLSAHISPSKLDRKQMWGGFFWIILLLIIFNILALLFKINLTDYLLRINHYLGILIAVFAFTTIISLLHFLLASIIFFPFRRR